MSAPRRRLLSRLALLIVVGLAVPAGFIAQDGLQEQLPPGQIDLAVVMGSKVETTGRPSARLAARLDRAVEVYKAGLVKRVLVSGGLGKEGFDEAKVMAQYLVEKGIPERDIERDGAGWDTFLTARHTAALMQRENLTSVMVITQWFHITRCRMAMRGFKLKPVYSAPARYFELRDVWSVVREVFGCVEYAFRSYERK